MQSRKPVRTCASSASTSPSATTASRSKAEKFAIGNDVPHAIGSRSRSATAGCASAMARSFSAAKCPAGSATLTVTNCSVRRHRPGSSRQDQKRPRRIGRDRRHRLRRTSRWTAC
ncbi:MAG: hypothetical protein MZU97_26410 [Bacillus subtilis]|nr:hypothetical protein [Bacillus subtilis]